MKITIPPLTYSPPQLVNWKAFVACMFTSKKSPGYDSIPMHVIKFSFHLISAPLADTINLSLLKGIFPDKLKIANLFPSSKQRILKFLKTTDLLLCCLIFQIFRKRHIQSLSRICRKTRYTLPLSLWISEKSLDIACTNSFGKLNSFCNRPTRNNGGCFPRYFRSI